MTEYSCRGTRDLSTASSTLERRALLKTAVGGAAGVSLAGCLGAYETVAGSSDEEEPITIGILTPDPNSDFIGRSIEHGVELAVDQLNDEDGILGREIETVIGDTNGSPLEARRQYDRLVLEEGADVTIGMFASEALEGIIDKIAEQETVHITAGSATSAVSRLVHERYDDYKYHFRAGPVNDVTLGQVQLDFLDEMGPEIGWDSVALLAEDYAWNDGVWETYEENLPTDTTDVTMWDRYSPSTNDFSEIYDEVAESGADAAYISTAHTGTDALLDWATEEREFAFGGIHVPMQLPEYYGMVGGACRYGVGYASATATSEMTEYTRPFVNDYEEFHDGSTPVYTGYIAYDAVNLFAEAVERAESLDSDLLVDELEETEHTGTTGTIEFYDRNHPHAHDVVYGEDNVHPVFFQWREDDTGRGVQETIWPHEQATTEYVNPEWL